MSKHTPGPWEIEKVETGFTVKGAKYVADVHEWVEQANAAESLANAHLIAAAPELLEALKAFCKRGAKHTKQDYLNALAAIAKAEGEGWMP